VETTPASEALVALPPVRRRLLWTLGLGAFGLAFSLTTTAAYLPPLLSRFTDSGGLIGAILGAEGVFALVISPVIGPWSDSFHTPMGRRRPFMLVALGPIGFSLLLMPFMPNLWTTVVVVMTFFFAYYIYETPYRGLYPDVLSADSFGRSQGIQHLQRGIALGVALVGGGLLFKLWKPSPFLLAAVLTTTACGLTILLVREDGGRCVHVGSYCNPFSARAAEFLRRREHFTKRCSQSTPESRAARRARRSAKLAVGTGVPRARTDRRAASRRLGGTSPESR
jgi:Na+/melibiose symporter-like transporter